VLAFYALESKFPLLLDRSRPQHYCFAACVIAQQDSSAAFVSLRSHSRKEKLGARFDSVVSFF
jgi:hypothetical protein